MSKSIHQPPNVIATGAHIEATHCVTISGPGGKHLLNISPKHARELAAALMTKADHVEQAANAAAAQTPRAVPLSINPGVIKDNA